MHILLTYLAARPLLNISELERAAKTHPRCIHNALQHHRDPTKGQPLAKKWVLPIIRALCAEAGSIEFLGWTIRNEEASKGFLLERPIPERRAKSKEIAAPDGGYYMEYMVPMYREYYDSGDFINFLQSQTHEKV